VLYIVPSRGRPANVNTLINAFRDTRSVTHLHIALDDDDPEIDGYMQVLSRQNIKHTDWLACSVFKRRSEVDGMVFTLNRAYEHVRERNSEILDAVGFMGDDHLPRTNAWDAKLLDEVAKGHLVVYGNDLLQGQNLPTAVLLDGRVPQALGYMCPHTLHHLYVDNVWKLWGTRTKKMRYRDDVIIEHMHPVIYKSATDERYIAVNNTEMYAHDEKAYHEYMMNNLDYDLAKLTTLEPR
jgi:hypothetical protein